MTLDAFYHKLAYDLKEIYSLAGEIKKDIYGKRVVVFAPLYVSDYCVNNCVYCGYKRDNSFNRRRLTMDVKW